jgi:hypothetical protein
VVGVALLKTQLVVLLEQMEVLGHLQTALLLVLVALEMVVVVVAEVGKPLIRVLVALEL